MKIYRYPEQKDWNRIIRRPRKEPSKLKKQVSNILESVKKKGDKALRKITRELEGLRLDQFQVTEPELLAAPALLSEELKTAIGQAKKNIEAFHLSQVDNILKVETMPGIVCWRRAVGIEKVGLYVPGGSAPLFSSVLMLAIPARIAGCREIIILTPATGKGGTIHPAILYTATLCGITKIYKLGGAQAIAAMAYGTESIPKVQKIFGPGNQYVTMAKQLVQQDGLAIDMPAGPSELLVIADGSADPGFIAADLLSQAEHGPDSQVLLLTNEEELVEKVMAEVDEQLKGLPRKLLAKKALRHSRIVILKDLEEAIRLSNLYAPEHLLLAVKEPQLLEPQIISAGSVFLGHYSPEAAGDYASGTNHSLPTNGYAGSYSGVSVDSFVKKITFQQLSVEGLRNIGETVMMMASAEGLDAHRNAIAIRMNKN